MFSANLTTFTSTESQQVSLREMLGGFEFICSFNGKTFAQQGDPLWLRLHGARVSMTTQAGRMELGTARPLVPHLIKQSVHPSFFQFELLLPLPHLALSALEDLRNGGEVAFEFAFQGVSGRGGATNDALENQTARVAVSQSDWIQKLNSAKARHIVLLEVAMSATEAPPHRRAAVEHLRSAESKFMAGLYTDCVSECRKGIETLKHSRGKFEWAKLQNADSRRAMDKDDRLGALAAVMHHFAHPSAHSESVGGVTNYSRSDARLALAVTAALLAHD